jgi:hypothetical protein
MLAVATTLAVLFATVRKWVLLSGGGHGVSHCD